MKYTNEIIINKPLDEVIKTFDSVENLKHWQPGLISFDHITGTAGQEGAKSKLVFQMGKRRMEMIETITKKNLPHEFHGTYDINGVHNIVENYFEKIDETTTRWHTVNEFQFSSFMMKLMGALMPFMFKKQSQQYLDNFKKYIEEGKSVLNK